MIENFVYIIVLFNIISIILASKNNRLTWVFGFIANSLTMALFFKDNHLMSFIYNIYNSIMCVIGFFSWNKEPKSNELELKQSNILKIMIYFVPLFIIIYIINIFGLKSNNIILDSIGSATAIFGSFLLVKKDINAWIFWMFGDIAYITLSILTNDYDYLIIYSVLFAFAIYSFIKNKKILTFINEK
ncbi:MAG: nicotinamide mononucleotide transporter [Bacilli bacterium]|nr:nicotinamide mononucleotide transporter [Bacilli bacterium]